MPIFICAASVPLTLLLLLMGLTGQVYPKLFVAILLIAILPVAMAIQRLQRKP